MSKVDAELRVVVHQTTPVLGEVAENEREIRRCVGGSQGADLLVFPELSLTGYTLRSRVQRLAIPLVEAAPLTLPQGSPPVALGLPERGMDELVYNTAVIQHRNQILAKHRKVYLPTYGLFDEARYFGRGRDAPPVVTLPSGWRVGLLICEDFWHPGLIYLLAIQGADVVLVLSAAPGRGDPGEAGEEEETPLLFSSPDTWTLLAQSAAVQYGIYMVLANRGGVEEGLTFAGGSMVVDPEGRVLAQAPHADPGTLEVCLTRQALRGARTPYAHLRDEDPEYLSRALAGILGTR